MRPTSSQGDRWSIASHELRSRSSHSCQSRPHPTSPREHTKTLTTVTTNAPSAPRTSSDAQRVCGRAGHVGLSSIWAASRSGPPTKVQQLLVSKLRTVKHHHRGSGAALGVTCPRTFCRRISRVGARRSWTQSQSQVCHRSRAARLVPDHESYRRSAPIHVV